MGSTSMRGQLAWTWARFEGLSLDDLYDALALRAQVFGVEQACAYLDPDGLDRQAWHLLARERGGRLVAYLRVVDPDAKYDVPSIGRVVVDPSRRGTGLGGTLMTEGLARCDAAWPGRANRISAQSHLQVFYAAQGYEARGQPYLEDDIPHIEMERPGS